MKTLSAKDKRTGIRIPLLSERVSFIADGIRTESDVGDITPDGAFLKTDRILKPKTPVTLNVQLPGDLGLLSLDGEVVRVNWTVNRKKNKDTLGMGIRFDNLNPGTRKILDAYVVYLRNKQIINVSKRIIEEFFGSQGPKK
jgi:hypothetical protein